MLPRSPSPRQGRPLLEVLEDRQLLAATLAPTGPNTLFPTNWEHVEALSSATIGNDPSHPGQRSLTVVGGPAQTPWGPSGGSMSLGNLPPHAVDDSFSTVGRTPLKIDVLANDSDPDGDKLKVWYVSQPQHGRLYRDASGSGQFIYRADGGFTGTDTFSYTAYDRWGSSDTASVKIKVAPGVTVSSVGQVVAKADTVSTHAGQAKSINVLANDFDTDGDALSIVKIPTAPAHGTAVIDNQRIVYTPDDKFVGDDTFSYQITDLDGGTSVGQVTVHVTNRPPHATDDYAFTKVDKPVEVRVKANDFDLDGDPLHIVSFTQPAHGSVKLDDGRLEFTPAPGFKGQASFSYVIGDPFGGRSQATVRIDVGNRAPVAGNDNVWVHPGIATAVSVLANDHDPDGDKLAILSFDATTVNGGTIAKQGATLVYTPKAGFTGTDTFHYTIVDPLGRQSSALVTVHVGDRAPQANLDMVRTDKNQPLTISVLSNDRDPDGDTLTLAGVAAKSLHGGAVVINPANPRQVIYTPKAGFVGRDFFTYTVKDGFGGHATGTVEVRVV